MKENLIYTDMIKRFHNGERDFSNVRIVNGNFDNLNLEGVVFANSTLTGDTTFTHANLENSDFSNAKLEFCSFWKAKLKNSSFNNAKIETSSFMEADLENTDFNGAEISWTLFMDSNYNAAHLKNAKLARVFFTWWELTKDDLKEALNLFGNGIENLPIGSRLEIKAFIETMKEKVDGLKFAYGKGVTGNKAYSSNRIGYNPHDEEESYVNQLKEIVYSLFNAYQPDKKTSKSYK